MDLNAVSTEVKDIKVRLFEVERVKESEQPLRERLALLNGYMEGVGEGQVTYKKVIEDLNIKLADLTKLNRELAVALEKAKAT